MNLYEMSQQQIIEKLDELRSDGGYRNTKAVNHRKLIALVTELEKRLAQLEAKNKLAWARLL